MIRSMTAFARRERQEAFGTLGCEIRSVNHRFLEPSFRLPEALRELEFPLRDRLRKDVHRGKVDISFRFEPSSQQQASIQINRELAAQLVRAAEEIDHLARHAAPLNATDILRLPGVIRTVEMDHEALLVAAQTLFADTIKDFLAFREREGAELKQLIESRLDGILQETAIVRERMPVIMQHYREKLQARLTEVKGELNAERLEQELILFAQKIDVVEELDRLTTHVGEVRRVLNGGGSAGRRLDFLMQELNREANTLGSKSVAADTSLSSVQLKLLIEQMREQIQNIE